MNETLHRQVISKLSESLGESLRTMYTVAYNRLKKVTQDPLGKPHKYQISELETSQGALVSVSNPENGYVVTLRVLDGQATLSVAKILATEFQGSCRYYD